MCTPSNFRLSRLLPLAIAALALACSDGGTNNPGGTGGGQIACSLSSDCPSGNICLSGFCQPDLGGGGGLDVASDAGSASDTDEADMAGDDMSGGEAGGPCQLCASADECMAGYECVSILSGKHCLLPCTGSSDCEAPYACAASGNEGEQHCLPDAPSEAAKLQCAGCLIDGCPDGQLCDASTGSPTCITPGGPCDSCQTDDDCGEDQGCVDQGGGKVCTPLCTGGAACPAGSACAAFVGGIEACTFSAETCCYGDTCTVGGDCANCPGLCVGGVCKDCDEDSDCDNGTCELSSHSCISAGDCTGDTPIKLPASGECVECINDTHCAASAGGPKCVQNKCSPSNQSNECAVCKEPYPGCVEINGTWSCVECATDADCANKGAGTCSTSTYTCSGTSQGPGASVKCKTDQDCIDNAGGNPGGFDLACKLPDGASPGTDEGYCYDKNGGCDNILAFCDSSQGSECVPLTDAFGAGGLPTGGGGLPFPIPGGGGAGGGSPLPSNGVCTCKIEQNGNPLSALCNFGLPPPFGCDCSADPNSIGCSLAQCCSSKSSDQCLTGQCFSFDALTQILGGLGGGGGAQPPGDLEGVCMAGGFP